jgi:hypothetical protein
VAVSLGLATAGYHTRSRPAAAAVGEDWRHAETGRRDADSKSKDRNPGGFAGAFTGCESERLIGLRWECVQRRMVLLVRSQ